MGDMAVDLDHAAFHLNGIWCSSMLSELAQKPACWTATAIDASQGVYAILSLEATRKAEEPRKTFVRKCNAGAIGYFLISEEDPALDGLYLWALVSISLSPFDGAPILFVWYTDEKRHAFEAMVANGLLPGRKLAEARQGSSLFGGDTEQTLILENLTEKHCTLIIERRGELLEIQPSDSLHRLSPIEVNPSEISNRYRPLELYQIEELDKTDSK
jgi:hypothetical protein